jgi:hypothetical protein
MDAIAGGGRRVGGVSLREIVGRQPELAGERRVPRRDHHPVAGDAAQLGQPGGRIGPVVHRPDRHRRVEAPVRKGQVLGRRLHRRRGHRRPLTAHDSRRLDCRHPPSRRLVGAGSGPDVQDGLGRAQCRLDAGGNPRLGAARRGITGADAIGEELPAHPN